MVWWRDRDHTLCQWCPGHAGRHVRYLSASFYLSQDEHRSYYLEELQAIAREQPRFDITAHHFYVQGALTLAFLEDYCPDFRDREVYLCGPPGMVSHLKPLLRKAGMAADAIHSEVFDFL